MWFPLGETWDRQWQMHQAKPKSRVISELYRSVILAMSDGWGRIDEKTGNLYYFNKYQKVQTQTLKVKSRKNWKPKAAGHFFLSHFRCSITKTWLSTFQGILISLDSLDR
jgi:hypothetical protein